MKRFVGLTLSWEVLEGVLEVRLHRGPCNEIGTATLHELEALADTLRAGRHGARALLMLSDQPKGFSAGADLRELYEGMTGLRTRGVRHLAGLLMARAPAGDDLWTSTAAALGSAARKGRSALLRPLVVREVRRFLTRIHRAFDALDQAPIPTFGALHGVVFGGGLELALTLDHLVADRTARLAFPELRLGIIPGFGGIPRLERDVGNAVVRDLLLTGRSFNARRAHELGLVSQVVGAGQAPAAARAAARAATRFEPATVAAAKAFAKPLPRARLDQEIETFLALVGSETVEAALQRFVSSTDVRPYL